MSEDPWYQQLRDAWKPESIRLLLVGESAPDDGGDVDQRRFFYAEPLSHSDNLFRSITAALYDSGKLTKGDSKAPWLERLREDGVYLIDLASTPVNALPPRERRAVLRESVVGCVENVKQLAPHGIIVCHSPTFQLLAGPLREASLPLLHDKPIPFPLGNKRREFIAEVRFALDGLRRDQTRRSS